MKFSRILVPTDFSPGAENAAIAAAALATAAGGRILLVHVYNPPSVMLPDGSTFPPTSTELVAADRPPKPLSPLPSARWPLESTVASTSTAAPSSARRPTRSSGSRIGRLRRDRDGHAWANRDRRLLLGSVAEKVSRSVSIPVLTVRQPEAHHDRTVDDLR